MNNKILVFAGAAYTFGAERITLQVISGLAQNGYQLKVLVSHWNDGSFIKELQKIEGVTYDTINLGWLYLTNFKWSFHSVRTMPGGLNKFLKIKKKFEPDYYYTTSYRPIILLKPFIASNTFIYNVQDPPTESKRDMFFIKMANSKVKYYTACSNYIGNELKKINGKVAKKVKVVHNSGFYTGLEKNEITNAEPIFGIVGQILPRKGHEDILEAMAIIKKEKNILIKLLIVGSGEQIFEYNLKKYIAENNLIEQVQWKGKVSTNIYKGIDVLLVPSRNNEPMALVLFEAGYSSVPVITTTTGGSSEIIKNNYNGFVIPPNNPQMLAQQMLQFYNNIALVIEYGKNGKENIENNYLKDHMIKKIIQII